MSHWVWVFGGSILLLVMGYCTGKGIEELLKAAEVEMQREEEERLYVSFRL